MTRNLAEVMLDVARLVMDVYDGEATAGTATTLTDTAMSHKADYFTAGTLWILSGANLGACRQVTLHSQNMLTFSALTGAVVAGVSYAVAPNVFSKSELKQAVLAVLRETKVPYSDTSLATVENQEAYTLPDGVHNVLRVDIANSQSSPYDYHTNYWWVEEAGNLHFAIGHEPQYSGYTMRIWYEAAQEEPDEDENISDAINLEWLQWAAAVKLWRKYAQASKKDDPTAIDMLNEAKVNEAALAAKKLNYSIHPSPRFGNW